MTYSSNNPLYQATNRLISSLEKLENNIRNAHNVIQDAHISREREAQQHQHLLSYQRENTALLEEQERMQTTILNLQQQYEELQGVAATIYGKLDNSIEKLNDILEKS
ncbi:MAG: hypothetical protein R3D71_09830 [Rickettsiales bacterium]